MFYLVDQSPSGGQYDYFEDIGISEYIVIEADTEDEARAKFFEIIQYQYTRGYGNCECCGDRWEWYMTDYYVFEDLDQLDKRGVLTSLWCLGEHGVGYLSFVHYKDGRIVGFPPLKAGLDTELKT